MKNLSFEFSPPAGGPMVLDVETQYLSDEVEGGWTAVHKFKVAVVVTWDEPNGLRVWYEEDTPRLLAEAEKFDPIVTFNGEHFDFKVLSAYGSVAALKDRSLDILARLSKVLRFRVKLDSLAQATLGRGKTGSGTESVKWWRDGDRQKVVEYCKMDVELTRDIYLFVKKNGYVMIDDLKRSTPQRIEISW